MAALKNEFTEDGKYHNLMRWLIYRSLFHFTHVSKTITANPYLKDCLVVEEAKVP